MKIGAVLVPGCFLPGDGPRREQFASKLVRSPRFIGADIEIDVDIHEAEVYSGGPG